MLTLILNTSADEGLNMYLHCLESILFRWFYDIVLEKDVVFSQNTDISIQKLWNQSDSEWCLFLTIYSWNNECSSIAFLMYTLVVGID